MTPAEQSVLAGLLESSGRIVRDLNIQASDFSTPAGETVFQTIVDLVDAGKPADLVTIATGPALTDPVIKAAGGAPWIWSLMDGNTSAASVPFHAEIVAEDSARRQIEQTATAMRQAILDGRDTEQILAEAQARIDALSSMASATTQAIGEGIRETIASLRKKPTYIETPWDDLNWLMHGWKQGGMYAVGARPSVGKTILGLQAAISLCNMGPVAYTSLEMDQTELQKRALAHIAKVDMSHIERHQITNDDEAKMERAVPLFEAMPLFIDPSSDGRVSQVVKHARAIKREHGLAAVVVDYIGLLTGGANQSEYEIITAASKRLKALAKELQVPVIVLSQLNRGIESRDNKEPRLSDLRNSGSIEQDADVVMLMHRELLESPHELKIIVAKNRQGTLGTATLDFAGHNSEIRNPR